MKKNHVLCFFVLILTILLYSTVFADSFSCPGGIISDGDKSPDVFAKCGPPDFRDSHQEEVSQRVDSDTKKTIYIAVEEWTYNLGPNQLMRIIVLKNGTVAEIRTGKYGYVKP